jgi:riboflavin kinase/FMN adenylyltransferase
VSQEASWNITGLVVPGEQRGRLIGFPTANVQVPQGSPLPPDGIYAGLVRSAITADVAATRALTNEMVR